MKTRALLIAAMLAPVAYGQLPSAQKYLDPAFTYVYTGLNVRPEKVKPFTDRAAELNKQRAALVEEGKKIDEARSSKKHENTQVPPTTNSAGQLVQSAQLPSAEEHERRVEAWRREAQAFRRETSEEFHLRRAQAGPVAEALGSWPDEIDAAAASLNPELTAPTPPTPPVAPKTAVAPVPPATGPKPSSVPGLPAGVEPAKKAAKDLPPGMSKR
jgi:hypothetical protein